MKTRTKVLIGFGIWFALAIVLGVLFGSDGRNDAFQPQEEFRLNPWTEIHVDSEFYDVFYSDEDGTFNLEGSYLTISGTFEHALPDGGGLNLAEIGLNFTDSNTEYGNYVASYVVLGDNSVEANVGNCIDGDLQTHTTMGNTVGQTDRLRLTLGFESTSGPPPR